MVEVDWYYASRLLSLGDDEVVKRAKERADAVLGGACAGATVVDAAVVRLPGAVNWYYPGSYQDMPSVASLLSGAHLAGGSLWMELPKLEVEPPVPASPLFVPAVAPMEGMEGMPSVASLLSAAGAVGSLWVDLPSPEAPEAAATVWMDLPRLEIAPRAAEAPLWPAALGIRGSRWRSITLTSDCTLT